MSMHFADCSFLGFSQDEDIRPGPSSKVSRKRAFIDSSSESDTEILLENLHIDENAASDHDGLSWHEPHAQVGPKPRDGRKIKKVQGRPRQKKLRQALPDASEEELSAFEALKTMTDERFFAKLRLPDDVFLEWLRELELIPRSRKCPLCNDDMGLKYDKRKVYPRWRCGKKECNRKEIGFFVGSFFERLQLTPKEVMKLVWKWSQKECKNANLLENFVRADDSTISQATIADWKMYLRELCTLDIAGSKKPIGGDNICVMIDETVITKRKYNRGALRATEEWFLGAVDTTGECWIVPVKDRSKKEVVPPIVESVLPGSILVMDCWPSYTSITTDYPEKLWQHFTCNHSDREHPFKDQKTGACTNAVEGLWAHFKARHKEERGTQRSMLLSHASEFLWRRKHKKNFFYHIIRCVRQTYSNW